MPATLTLPPRCTLVQAEELAARCRDALAAGQGLRIDAAPLEEGDVSLLQILIAAQKSCAAAGCEFALVSSPALDALAQRAGFAAGTSGLTAPSPLPAAAAHPLPL